MVAYLPQPAPSPVGECCLPVVVTPGATNVLGVNVRLVKLVIKLHFKILFMPVPGRPTTRTQNEIATATTDKTKRKTKRLPNTGN